MKKRLLKRFICGALAAVTVVTQMQMAIPVSGAETKENTVNTDVAVYGEVSSDYTSPWENLKGINNPGFEPVSSNAGPGLGWGNWQQTAGTTHWVQYDWESEITTEELQVYWYDDAGATRVPSDVSIQYKDKDGNWKDADIKTDFAEFNVLNKYNTINIGEITTSSIRFNMVVAQGAQAMGIYRLKVMAQMMSEEVLNSLLGKISLDKRATMDFQLPAYTGDVMIKWSGEGHPAINIVNGWAEITRSADDVTGTIKATLNVYGSEVSKEFPITVAGESEKNTAEAVDFTKVSVTDKFWSARQKAIICQTILTGIDHVEAKNGGLNNFIAAAKVNKKELETAVFEGSVYFLDSDVYKMIEAMSYALQIDSEGSEEIKEAQQKIKDTLEKWIPYIEGAQESDGYLDTFFTLNHKANANFANNTQDRWTDFSLHELYCTGHFFEGAVAYTRAKNYEDTRLLDVAVKNADLTVKTFGLGENQIKACPGHEEIELALIKLAAVCEEMGDREYEAGVTYRSKAESYIRLAQFFLSVRGDTEDRYGYNSYTGNFNSEYDQENQKVTDITDPVGHAVRCMYLYTGMADVALLKNTDIYDKALLTVWENLTEKKSYVTGGIGSSAANEGFGNDYDLPNETAYAETCANIGSFIWNSKMNLLYGDSKYVDVMEKTLYNSILSGINFDGDKFFYSNPHYSNGTQNRSAWFGCACCPPNLMRLVESLGSYIYTQNGNEIAMNLYISNDAELKVDEKDFCLSVNTQMPWNGKTEIEITKAGNGTDKNTDAVLRLRIPEWADGSNKVYVNGEEVSAEADATGYINITKSWSENDKITLDLEMNTVRYYDKEEIKNNIGCVAVKRGPVIYAAEAADNDFDINKAYLPADSKLETVWSENLMNDNDDVYGLKSGMYVTASGIVDDFGVEKEVQWKLIPYYAWNNRGNGNMRIYISENKVKTSLRDYANVSASYSFETTLQNINDNSKDTFWNGWNDPKLQSENQWVMYDFGKNKAQLTGMTVNWYDDRSGVAVPEKIIVEYWNDDTEGWEEVTATSDFSKCINKEDNLYTFEKVTTSKIRMTMVNGTIDGSKKVAAAIFDWDLIGEFDSSVNKPELPDDTEETTENPQPELPDDTEKTEVPQPETGDESNPWLYVVICMFAALCGVSAFIWKNKKGGRTCQK